MTIIVVFLGCIQALSEFLPISSSAHLLLFPWLFQFSDPGLGFDAAIHIGTALALVAFFYKDFWTMIKTRDRLFWMLIVATIPGAIIGFLGEKMIDVYLHQSSVAPLIVGIGLIIFAGLLYVVDKIATSTTTIGQMSWTKTITVGLAQSLALIPGVSRSGITLSAGMLLGLKRSDAARFSFLLATPITLGAGLYKLTGLIRQPNPNLTSWQLILGILVSGLLGFAVIKWLLSYLNNHRLSLFIIYRIVLGLIIISVWLIRR